MGKHGPTPLRSAAMYMLTLALASGGAALFWYLHLPLPWLLGSMFFTSAAAIARLPVAIPGFSRPPMTAVIGTILGASYLYFRKVAGFDHPTAYFAGMPGGLIEMVALGTERGGDERLMALVHSARIFLVVMSLPFILQSISGMEIGRGVANWVPMDSFSSLEATWFLGTLICGVGLGTLARFPARYLLGPLTVSGIVHYFTVTDFSVPSVFLCIAQVVIGSAVGARFASADPKTIVRVLALSFGSTAQLLIITVASAFVVSQFSSQSCEALVLAYSPGGLAEMSLMALALHVEVPFVVLHHIVRVLFVVAGATTVFKFLPKAGEPK